MESLFSHYIDYTKQGLSKVVFSVTKIFSVKGSGKTVVGCNEGGVLPNIDSPAKLNGLNLAPGYLKRGSFGFGSNRLGSPMVINCKYPPISQKVNGLILLMRTLQMCTCSFSNSEIRNSKH